MQSERAFQAFDNRTNRVIGEFPTLDEAKATLEDWDDIYILRIEEDGPPEVCWEQ